MGSGKAPRRAHLRRVGRRRQFAVELSDHRLAARRRRPDPGDAAGAGQRRRRARRHRLPECARHIDRHERPQRKRRRQGRVRSGCRQPVGEFDQEHDGPPDRRRRRGRGRHLRARDPRRPDADQREPGRGRSRLRPEPRPRRAAPPARSHDDVQFVRIRRLEQLHRAAQSRGCRRCAGRPRRYDGVRHERRAHPDHRRGRRVLRRQVARRNPGGGDGRPIVDRAGSAVGRRAVADAARRRSRRLQPTRNGRGSQAAQAHPAHRSLRPLRGGSRDRRRGAGRASRNAGRGRSRDVFRPHRRVRRFGQRQFPEPVRLFSAADGGERQPAGIRPRTGQHRQSDVAPALAAEQRAGTHRHQIRA